MNDEIKEILDRLDYNEWEVDLYKVPITWCELYNIRDYITNLQQENEKLHKELDYADNYNIYLISKIDKSIEYIKENIADIEYMEKNYDIDFLIRDGIETEYNYIKTLLNILKGRDE